MTRPQPLPHASGTRRTCLDWIAVDTIGSNATVIADGNKPRAFTRLERTRLAHSAAVARQLPDIVHHTTTTTKRQFHKIHTPKGSLHLHAVPVAGPTGAVHAVQLWAGTADQTPPVRPSIGALEYDTASGTGQLTPPAAQRLGIAGREPRRSCTLAHLFAHFDRFDDRLAFLALFDPAAWASAWSGTATTDTHHSIVRRNLHLVARNCVDGDGNHIVRGLIQDITVSAPPPAPPLEGQALRHMFVPPGRSVCLMDLRTGLIHQWIAEGTTPVNRWAIENPDIHRDSAAEILLCRSELLAGASTAAARVRIRFAANDPWITVDTRWNPVHCPLRPQALLDITVKGGIIG